jgi:hypothetical protein
LTAKNETILKQQQIARAMSKELKRDVIENREKELAMSFESNCLPKLL